VRTIVVALVSGLIISACGVGASERANVLPQSSSTDPSTCPVTVPPRPGFVPPDPYPPELVTGVWYGTPELWTSLPPDGAVWDVPVQPDGGVANKTLWWSENFSTAEREDFSGNDDITISAVHLNGTAPKVIQKGGVPSFNRITKNFLLVPLGLPEPGCWEVTVSYQEADLSYVLQAKG
jgi:hypothetical protein